MKICTCKNYKRNMDSYNKHDKDSLQQFQPNINPFLDSYVKKLEDNAGKRKFWENYLKCLTDIDFNFYSKKLKVPVLVPIGKRIFFRGELKHTNEVFVSLHSNYFTKCSLDQADILRQHRIKDGYSKLEIYEKERLYLENQLKLRGSVLENPGQEIIEVCTEEEDRAWRLKHRENVRMYYKKKQKNEMKEEHRDHISDEDLWRRLEELELQEDLQNELYNTDSIKNRRLRSTMENHQENLKKEVKEKYFTSEGDMNPLPVLNDDTYEQETNQMKDILDKQNELKKRIKELQNNEGKPMKTESDLLSKLDKMGQIEEIEDEIYRLDDVIYKDASEEEDKSDEKSISKNIKRSVTFADEDESETLELSFRHSEMKPCTELYDPKKGILKPSDIYVAFSDLFTETTPILRKTKYEFSNIKSKKDEVESKKPNIVNDQMSYKVISVKDVTEKSPENKKITSTNSGRNRPMSVFKKRRQNKY